MVYSYFLPFCCFDLQALDLKNMQVISQVLAQSVAMDFYSRWVLGCTG